MTNSLSAGIYEVVWREGANIDFFIFVVVVVEIWFLNVAREREKEKIKKTKVKNHTFNHIQYR